MRRPRARRREAVVWHRWAPAWLGLAGLATANGAVREAVYAEPLGDLAAHQVSTAVLIGVSGGYVWLLQQRWPLPSTGTALRVGASWTVMTLSFEFGAGHYLFRSSWQTLLADYDFRQGRVWLLVPLWLFVAPALARSTVRVR